MTDTHQQKLQKSAELLARKPARMMELILIKAFIGVVDGSVEAMHEEQAKTEKLEVLIKGLLDAYDKQLHEPESGELNANHYLRREAKNQCVFSAIEELRKAVQ